MVMVRLIILQYYLPREGDLYRVDIILIWLKES